jgi:hypothetical protein
MLEATFCAHPFETPRNSEKLVLVFKGAYSPSSFARVILVWMGPRSQMERELRRMLVDERFAKSAETLYGIDCTALTRFQVTVKRSRKRYKLITLYLTKPRSIIERELLDLAAIPKSPDDGKADIV